MTRVAEVASLLLEAADRLAAEGDAPLRRRLLATARELRATAAAGGRRPRAWQPGPRTRPGFPVQIFAVRLGRRYEAELLADFTVRLGDRLYFSVSKAGRAVTGYQTNGWTFWQYQDPLTGHVRPIDDLRRR